MTHTESETDRNSNRQKVRQTAKIERKKSNGQKRESQTERKSESQTYEKPFCQTSTSFTL